MRFDYRNPAVLTLMLPFLLGAILVAAIGWLILPSVRKDIRNWWKGLVAKKEEKVYTEADFVEIDPQQR